LNAKDTEEGEGLGEGEGNMFLFLFKEFYFLSLDGAFCNRPGQEKRCGTAQQPTVRTVLKYWLRNSVCFNSVRSVRN